MTPSGPLRWYLDAGSWGGLVSERLLAALPLCEDDAQSLMCGLVFTIDSPGAPRIAFWERIDDLSAQGFVPIRPSRARAICDALPRFLDRLDEARGERRQAREEGERGDAVRAGVGLC